MRTPALPRKRLQPGSLLRRRRDPTPAGERLEVAEVERERAAVEPDARKVTALRSLAYPPCRTAEAARGFLDVEQSPRLKRRRLPPLVEQRDDAGCKRVRELTNELLKRGHAEVASSTTAA